MRIFAIDPGNVESAYVVIDSKTLEPIEVKKTRNEEVRKRLYAFINKHHLSSKFAIEMVASYGMAVGKTVFDTCVWIGRFAEIIETFECKVDLIYRKNVKLNLCQNMRAKDSNITQALIDRFAHGVGNKGKGTKANPGWFYGFKKDIWQAYAVAVTFADMKKRGEI